MCPPCYTYVPAENSQIVRINDWSFNGDLMGINPSADQEKLSKFPNTQIKDNELDCHPPLTYCHNDISMVVAELHHSQK